MNILKKLKLIDDNDKITNKELLKIILLILSTIFVEIVFYYIGDSFGYRAHLLIPSIVDNFIVQNNHFVYFYIYWYVMLIKVPLVLALKDNSRFKKYINSVYVSLIIGLLTFIIYPTIMDRPILIVNNLSDKILSIVHIFSTPTKCVPSMHVVLCTLFIMGTTSSKQLSKTYKIIINIISILIILSTLFVKQHLFIDVITGIIVGIISWLIGSKLKKFVL